MMSNLATLPPSSYVNADCDSGVACPLLALETETDDLTHCLSAPCLCLCCVLACKPVKLKCPMTTPTSS